MASEFREEFDHAQFRVEVRETLCRKLRKLSVQAEPFSSADFDVLVRAAEMIEKQGLDLRCMETNERNAAKINRIHMAAEGKRRRYLWHRVRWIESNGPDSPGVECEERCRTYGDARRLAKKMRVLCGAWVKVFACYSKAKPAKKATRRRGGLVEDPRALGLRLGLTEEETVTMIEGLTTRRPRRVQVPVEVSVEVPAPVVSTMSSDAAAS